MEILVQVPDHQNTGGKQKVCVLPVTLKGNSLLHLKSLSNNRLVKMGMLFGGGRRREEGEKSSFPYKSEIIDLPIFQPKNF